MTGPTDNTAATGGGAFPRPVITDLMCNHKAIEIAMPIGMRQGKMMYFKYLVSYETVVCAIDSLGEFHLFMKPSLVTNTTARHINRFLECNYLSLDWRKAKPELEEA